MAARRGNRGLDDIDRVEYRCVGFMSIYTSLYCVGMKILGK